MHYSSIITQLYFVLIYADGQVNEHEIQSGNQIVNIEALDEEEFKVQLQLLKSKDPAILLAECIKGLKKLDRKQQIRVIAWLCVVANGDGFMDKTKWQLIYRIYHRELNLPLEEIFIVQKELSFLPHKKSAVVPSKSVA